MTLCRVSPQSCNEQRAKLHQQLNSKSFPEMKLWENSYIFEAFCVSKRPRVSTMVTCQPNTSPAYSTFWLLRTETRCLIWSTGWSGADQTETCCSINMCTGHWSYLFILYLSRKVPLRYMTSSSRESWPRRQQRQFQRRVKHNQFNIKNLLTNI